MITDSMQDWARRKLQELGPYRVKIVLEDTHGREILVDYPLTVEAGQHVVIEFDVDVSLS